MTETTLNQAYEKKRSDAVYVPPSWDLSKARTEHPGICYALDANGNRLFPYSIAPDMDEELKIRLMMNINRCCLSETGRDTLQQASEMGHSFRLYAENDGRGGFYDDSRREICMNVLNCSDDFLCSALVHEARHSIQFDQVPQFREEFKNNDLDFKSYMIVNRAIESDAVAVQAKFAAEMERCGHTGIAAGMRKDPNYVQVMAVIDQASAKGELDRPDTLKKAADGWYKSPEIMAYYDDYYTLYESCRVSWQGNRERSAGKTDGVAV